MLAGRDVGHIHDLMYCAAAADRGAIDPKAVGDKRVDVRGVCGGGAGGGGVPLLVRTDAGEAGVAGAVRLAAQEAARGGEPALRAGGGAHPAFVRTLWVLIGLLAAIDAGDVRCE